jgi:tetratricopeptide (TPR) repeat protein
MFLRPGSGRTGPVGPRRGAAALLGLLLLVGTGAAAADDAVRARQHYETGTRRFEVGEYRKALEEFQAAHVAKPDPAFLYNTAQCHRLLGEKREALTLYRRYLILDPQTPNRALVEKHIRELELAAPAPVNPAPSAVLSVRRPAPSPPQEPPLYRRWWLWAAVGAVAAGVVTAVVLSGRGSGDPGCPGGVKCFP